MGSSITDDACRRSQTKSTTTNLSRLDECLFATLTLRSVVGDKYQYHSLRAKVNEWNRASGTVWKWCFLRMGRQSLRGLPLATQLKRTSQKWLGAYQYLRCNRPTVQIQPSRWDCARIGVVGIAIAARQTIHTLQTTDAHLQSSRRPRALLRSP